MKMKYLIGTIVLVTSLNSQAGVINTTFDNSNGLTTFGSANITNGVALLTQAQNSQTGTVVFDSIDSVAVKDFSGSFDFTLSNAFGGGADGISFGFFDSVAGLSYVSGIAEEGATTGLAIGFDTWLNGGFDNSVNSVSVRFDGVLVSQLDITNSLFQFDQGSNYQVDFDFTGGLLNLDVTTDSTTLNVFSNLLISGWTELKGQFYFGGRTGGAGNLQVVDNFNVQTSAEEVSAPATLALFGLGLMVVFSRRK